MVDFIIIAGLAVVVVAAVRYIYKEKKSGAKCIGCSAGNCGCCSGSKLMDEATSCGSCCSTDKK